MKNERKKKEKKEDKKQRRKEIFYLMVHSTYLYFIVTWQWIKEDKNN